MNTGGMPPYYNLIFCSYHTFILQEYPLHSSLYIWFMKNLYHHQTIIHIKRHTDQGWDLKRRIQSKRKEEKKQVWEDDVQKQQNENYSLVTNRLAAEAFIRQCHAYNYVCTVWGSLANAEKTSVVMSPEFYIKKRDEASRFTQPKQCLHPKNGSSPSLHPLLRVPHPISKSIKCVCEPEEAHQLTTTAPPPFFPPSLLDATEPCRPPPIAHR